MHLPFDITEKINSIMEDMYTTTTFNGCIKYENDEFEIIVQNKSNIIVIDKRIDKNRVVYKDLATAYQKIKGAKT